MKMIVKLLITLILGISLFSCSNPTKPPTEPPIFINLSFDTADWVLYITGATNPQPPNETVQHVMLNWLGDPIDNPATEIPILYINSVHVPLVLQENTLETHLSGSFSQPANTIIQIELKSQTKQSTLLDTELKLVQQVTDFYTTNPYNFEEDNMLSWYVPGDSQFQLFEAYSDPGNYFKYISPSQRDFILKAADSQALNHGNGFVCQIRQINYLLKNRIAVYSTSFAHTHTGTGSPGL